MVPEQVRLVLSPFLPHDTPWDVDFQVGGRPRVAAEEPAPRSFVPRAVMAVSASGPERTLQTAAISQEDRILFNPSFYSDRTASGLALWAHELHHQWQMDTIPDFLEQYREAEAMTPPGQPWANPFELSAYRVECRVYHDLVARGVPPGTWVPLGVTAGLC